MTDNATSRDSPTDQTQQERSTLQGEEQQQQLLQHQQQQHVVGSRRDGVSRSRRVSSRVSLDQGLALAMWKNMAPTHLQPVHVGKEKARHAPPVTQPVHKGIHRSSISHDDGLASSVTSWSSSGSMFKAHEDGDGLLFPKNAGPSQDNAPQREVYTLTNSSRESSGRGSTTESSFSASETHTCRICDARVGGDLQAHEAHCEKVHAVNASIDEHLETISETLKDLDELPRGHAVITKLQNFYDVGVAVGKAAMVPETKERIEKMVEQYIQPNLQRPSGGRPSFLEKNVIAIGQELLEIIQEKLELLPKRNKQRQHGSSKDSTELHRVNVKDFEIINPIEKGAFGAVFLVQKKSTGDIFALKRMNKRMLHDGNSHKRLDRITTELLIMSSSAVASPFLCKLYQSFQTKSNLYLVMEYVDGGDLLGYLQRSPEGVIDESEAVTIFAELVLAIAHLHNCGIVHRDIKPANVLLTSGGHVKLTDFGLSRYLEDPGNKGKVVAPNEVPEELMRAPPISAQHGATYSMVGTPEYIAPEILSGDGYDYSVDWWALGVLLYECLIGFPPFYHEDSGVLLSHIVHNNLLEPSALSSGVVSHDARTLIEGLMERDPHYRMSVQDIKNHPWFTFVNWEELESTVDISSSPWIGDRSQATKDLIEKFNAKRAQRKQVSMEDFDMVARKPGDPNDPNFCPGSRDCENCDVKVCDEKMPGFTFTAVNRFKALNEHIRDVQARDSASSGTRGPTSVDEAHAAIPAGSVGIHDKERRNKRDKKSTTSSTTTTTSSTKEKKPEDAPGGGCASKTKATQKAKEKSGMASPKKAMSPSVGGLRPSEWQQLKNAKVKEEAAEGAVETVSGTGYESQAQGRQGPKQTYAVPPLPQWGGGSTTTTTTTAAAVPANVSTTPAAALGVGDMMVNDEGDLVDRDEVVQHPSALEIPVESRSKRATLLTTGRINRHSHLELLKARKKSEGDLGAARRPSALNIGVGGGARGGMKDINPHLGHGNGDAARDDHKHKKKHLAEFLSDSSFDSLNYTPSSTGSTASEQFTSQSPSSLQVHHSAGSRGFRSDGDIVFQASPKSSHGSLRRTSHKRVRSGRQTRGGRSGRRSDQGHQGKRGDSPEPRTAETSGSRNTFSPTQPSPLAASPVTSSGDVSPPVATAHDEDKVGDRFMTARDSFQEIAAKITPPNATPAAATTSSSSSSSSRRSSSKRESAQEVRAKVGGGAEDEEEGAGATSVISEETEEFFDAPQISKYRDSAELW